MSDHKLISEISGVLRNLVQTEFAAARITQSVELKPPPDATGEKFISLWLYHITENEFVKNQPLINQRAAGNGNGNGSGPQHQAQYPPLALNLYYLITPMIDQSTTDQQLLGKAMEVLYDNGIVFVRATDGSLHELRISLCRMTLEEQTRVWDARRQAYHLSACYQVRVARIDSLRGRTTARIIDQSTGVGTINREAVS